MMTDGSCHQADDGKSAKLAYVSLITVVFNSFGGRTLP